jgi:dolichol-phosphate mannosyltransferase
VPCFNEQEVLDETHRRLTEVLAGLEGYAYELIYIDDGSSDQTLPMLQRLQATDGNVRVLSFSRNFGHQMAVSAGVDAARGDAVVLIDADLQDPPEVIEKMLEKWKEGYHIAYGRRVSRAGENRFKRWSAAGFYRLLNKLSDIPIPLDTGDFRLMDRAVVDVLLEMPERDRFLRGMISWIGFRQVGVPYERAARFAGESKYPLAKMIRFATDGFISFSVKPLRLATWMGFLASGLALLGIIYALVLRLLTDIWVPGWTALFIAVMFFGGVQLIAIGIIGEYVGRAYGEVKRRPLYVVQERLGFPEIADSPAGRSDT